MEKLHTIRHPGMTAAVGHHMGVQEYLTDHLTPEEKEILEPLSPRKRREWLASRELLYQIWGLPERPGCVYDDFGKPVLRGSTQHISISHSERWCAAMISDQPCGIDIQVYSATIRRIATRFLSADELAVAQQSTNPLHSLHVLWGAKESIYKAFGKRKLGFREHIFIHELHPGTLTAKGEIHLEGLPLQYDIEYRMLPEVAWVFCRLRPAVLPAGDR